MSDCRNSCGVCPALYNISPLRERVLTVFGLLCPGTRSSDCLSITVLVTVSQYQWSSQRPCLSQSECLSVTDSIVVLSQWLSLVTVSGSQFQWLSLSPSDSHSQWLSLSSIKCISTHWMSLSLSYCLTVACVFSPWLSLGNSDCLLLPVTVSLWRYFCFSFYFSVSVIVSHSQWLFLFDGISVLVSIFKSQGFSLSVSD